MLKSLTVEFSVFLMIALVALSGFASLNSGDDSVSSQNLIDSSGNALTGDLSLKKIKKSSNCSN